MLLITLELEAIWVDLLETGSVCALLDNGRVGIVAVVEDRRSLREVPGEPLLEPVGDEPVLVLVE